VRAGIRAFSRWWAEDPYRPALGIGGFLFAVFLVQGLPYWDVDYGYGFATVHGRSLLRLVLEWLSPIGRGENWGFLDRGAQLVVYKICYAIAGYDAWPFALIKSVCFAGLGVVVYSWALRVVPAASNGRHASLAAALFLLAAPGPVGSLAWLADFAPVAEFAFAMLTFVIWRQIEETPAEWEAIWPLDSPEKRAWLLKWTGLSFAVYLAYGTKADLKVIPAILAVYVWLLRKRQWKLFGPPIVLMLLLAVPWSWTALTTLPPFVPGSSAKPVGYSWQPASFEMMREFLWSSQPYDFVASLKGGTISLGGLVGPFLLPAMLAFLFWRIPRPFKISWTVPESAAGRARLFVVLWLGAILLSTSALPAINYFFRIRWGILLLTPCCILLAWVFGLFTEACSRLPRWASIGCIALFTLQAGINLNRSVWHRRELGQVMMSVDQVYAHVDEKFPDDELALWPGFLSYGYRQDASPAIRLRDALAAPEDLQERHTPNRTLVIAWSPSLWEQLDVVKQFDGCGGTTLFETIVPCAPPPSAVLMRYIGPDPEYEAAATARAAGDLSAARQLYEAFLARHPNNLGARFQRGSLAQQQKDWSAAERAFASLEGFLPDAPSVLYNRAIAMLEMNEAAPAVARLERVVEMEPGNLEARSALHRAHIQNEKNAGADDPIATAKPPAETAADTLPSHAYTPEDYLDLSLRYYRDGRPRDCIAAAKEALRLEPGFAEAYNNMAAGYGAVGMWDEAIQAATEALHLKPDFPLARNNLAWSSSQKARQQAK
jgi:tetratricopeptide (TPR) repeat protein